MGRNFYPGRFGWVLLLLWSCFGGARFCAGYSMLTHEHIVDVSWEGEIQPLLLKRFPNATAEDLRKAHAHAYGGCLIHDIGYYPLGSKLFSDITHYVRSGDFVANLIRESTNLNEYAFAFGAMAHYTSDTVAHPVINRAVALTFPKLRSKFGEEVTYADDPVAHARVEFGFDVTQIAKNRYTPDSYRAFIGFEIPKPLVERAFFKTYGLKLSQVLKHEDQAIGTFRWAVSEVFPQLTRVALSSRRAEIIKDNPDFDEKKFVYHLSRAEYEKEWGKEYRKPGMLARLVGFSARCLAKIGIVRATDFKVPTAETENLYVQSVNQTVATYKELLRKVGSGNYDLENLDFDTGKSPHASEYKLSDKTYARLLDQHSKTDFKFVSPELRDDIVSFYANAKPSVTTKKEAKAWRKTQKQLANLRLLQR